MKYYFLKFHICWEINNLISCLEFIAQWAFYSFFFLHRCHGKKWIGFSLFFSGPRWPIDFKLLQICQFIYLVDYIKCLHCQQLFCQQNQFCNVPLNVIFTEGKSELSFIFSLSTCLVLFFFPTQVTTCMLIPVRLISARAPTLSVQSLPPHKTTIAR